MSRRLLVSALLIALTFAASASADDVWVLRGFVVMPGCVSSPLDLQFVWRADPLLYNTGTSAAVVRARAVSNGGHHGQLDQPIDIVIPPGEVRGVAASASDFAPSPLWITRLDVPPGVLVEGRLEYTERDCSFKPKLDLALGRVSTPVFRELTPPGVRTIHPGTDLGIQNVRTNVGIYNAGSVTASAIIEVKRAGCPDQTPVTQVVAIPPDTLIQTSVFEMPPRCTMNGTVPDWIAYTTVTVDQPSLSYVVALSNSEKPHVTFGFSGAR